MTAGSGPLREEEREAVLLRAWGALSYEEIARVTGARPGTVRSRLNRARARCSEIRWSTLYAVASGALGAVGARPRR